MASGAAPRKGAMRRSTQSARPMSLRLAGAAGSGRWFRPGRPRRDSTRRTAIRPGPPVRVLRSSWWARPGAACRRPGNTRPRPRPAARRAK
jgi:hypothetical protein